MASAEDVLDSFPSRADVAWSDEAGGVHLAVPKARSRIERLLVRVLRAPTSTRVALDAVGSDAWRLADGSRSARSIAVELERLHGEAARPGEARAVSFFSALALRGLVHLRRDAAAAPAPAAPGFPDEDGWRDASCGRCGAVTRVQGPPRTRLACPKCRRLLRAP